MELREIGRLFSDDTIALISLWNRKGTAECPYCKHPEFYYLGRGRVRCRSCKRDFWPLQRTRFSLIKITPSQWLSLIKLFEISVTARKAAHDTGLSYKTAHKAFTILRRTLVEEATKEDALFKGELEADESYFGGSRKGKRGRGAGHKTILYVILERGGRVSGSIVPNASAESLLTETVKKVRWGSIVYTDIGLTHLLSTEKAKS